MKTTLDIIKTIYTQNPDIASFKVIEYQPQKDIKKDLSDRWTQCDESVFQNALNLRREHQIPFWNAIMASCINNKEWSRNCLSASLRHNPIRLIAEIASSKLELLPAIEADGDRKSINSEVTMKDGSVKHIPMLDFHIPYGDDSTEVVKEICNLLGIHGYVLSSGRSYHFIGTELVDFSGMVKFLSKALLFTPIVDEIWIAHQLQDGSCSLRYGVKHGVVPTVICRV